MSGETDAATVSAGGLVTAVATGSITITADYGGLHATAALTVGAATAQTITVTPANPTIAKGTTQQFTATVHYSDGTTADRTSAASWSSATTSVATIASGVSGGLASGVAAGTSLITASYGGASGNTTLTVTGPALVSISVTPPSPSVARFFDVRFTAVGIYTDGSGQDLTGQVTWTSGTGSVATIDPTGLASPVSPGTSQITATSGAIAGHTTLTVTPAALSSVSVAPLDPTIAPGAILPFFATGHFDDGTTHLLADGVTWSSGTPSVATVDPTGLATGLAIGTSTVTATALGLGGSSLLTVAATPPGVSWAYETTSPDATPCTACTSPEVTLTSIIWTGTQFMAVGLSGAIVTSPDGLAWTTRVAGASYGGLWYGPLTSVTWASSLGRSSQPLYGVTWTGVEFMAVGGTGGPGAFNMPGVDGYPGCLSTSPDGITWTSRSMSSAGTIYGTTYTIFSVAWNGTRLVAVGSGVYPRYFAYTSP